MLTLAACIAGVSSGMSSGKVCKARWLASPLPSPAGGEVKMEVWSISPDMYQVFTNADDDSTKKGLSIALKDNNVPLSALSSLQKDFSWTLKC